MNYEENIKYFYPRKKPTGRIAVVLLSLMYIGFAFLYRSIDDTPVGWQFVLSIVAAVAIAATAVWAIFKFRIKYLTDAEVDEVVRGELKNIEKDALKKFGLTKDDKFVSDPYCECNYEFGMTDVSDYISRIGKDGMRRSTYVTYTGLFFCEKCMLMYIKLASLATGAASEKTMEYYYKDIVSVEYSDDKIEISTSGGNKVEVFGFSSEDADTVVNKIRSLVRKAKD